MEFRRSQIPRSALTGPLLSKWSYEVLQEGFTPFPKRLTRCVHRVFAPPLGMEHLAVVMAVIDYQRPNLTRQPSLEFLAFLAGLGPAETASCLADLQSDGLLRVRDTGLGVEVNASGLFERIKKETPNGV